MKAAERRAQRDLELAVFTAHIVARLTTYGGKKLQPLAELLRAVGPKAAVRKQDPKSMIAAMRAIAATRPTPRK